MKKVGGVRLQIDMITKLEIYEKQVIGQNCCRQVLDKIAQQLKPGVSELEIYNIAKSIIKSDEKIQGIWHPIVIKFDQSTLITGVSHKPDASTLYKEIAIIDLGIIVDGIELDYAQTFGISEEAKQLVHTTDKVLLEFTNLITKQKISPQTAFEQLCIIAKEHKVTQIAETAGHLLGLFPTMKSKVKISAEQSSLNSLPPGSWMLEVHLSNSRIAAFKEELVFIPE